MSRFTWPFAAIIGMALGFVVAIFWLIPSDMPEARSALLGVIMTGVGATVTAAVGTLGHQIDSTNHKVDQLTRQTNGHMTSLIAAKTQPDVSRETTPDVSRETKEPE